MKMNRYLSKLGLCLLTFVLLASTTLGAAST